MAHWKNEDEARKQIKDLVTKYYHEFKEKKDAFQEGDRIHMQRVSMMKKKCVR